MVKTRPFDAAEYLTPAELEEMTRELAEMKDEEIDTTDIPEVRDWSGAVRGKFHGGTSEDTNT